jgi:serine/threonine-protein kinase RsbW
MSIPHDDGSHHEAPTAPDDLHYPAIPAEAGRIARLRHAVAQWATAIGLAADRVQQLALATYEAMANVVTHAYRDRTGVFELRATYRAEHRQVTITVTDHGHWRPARAPGPGPSTGGRGLPLIRALAEDTSITTSASGTSVHMCWTI